MENTSLDFGGLVSESKEYVETKLELWKLKAVDKIAVVTTLLIARVILFIILMCFWIMLSIGVALWIGKSLGSNMYGFFIVAAFYGIAGLIIYFFRNALIKAPIGNKLVEALLKEDNE